MNHGRASLLSGRHEGPSVVRGGAPPVSHPDHDPPSLPDGMDARRPGGCRRPARAGTVDPARPRPVAGALH
jgi:hypothetical protein